MSRARNIKPEQVFVYLIGEAQKAGPNLLGPIKAGFSVDPDDRLRGLQTGMPFLAQLLVRYPVRSSDWARAVETATLDYFGNSHLIGEWFTATPSEAAEVVADLVDDPGEYLRRYA